MRQAPLFLTRASLKRRSLDVAPLIALLQPKDDGQALNTAHRLLWTLMPEEAVSTAPGGPGRSTFLWRETRERGVYLILGPKPRGESPYFSVESKPFELSARPGDWFRYDLRLNATVNRIVGRDEAGKAQRMRTDVVIDEIHAMEQRAAAEGQLLERADLRWPAAGIALQRWLERQGEKHGFRVHSCKLDSYLTVVLPRVERRKRGKHPDLGIATITGAIEVLDPEMFSDKVASGFGRAKAFGCGLMLLARAGAEQSDD